ncbi:MAG: imidazoleglycerol-phosphate dehydratase HisB [Clostridiales bacterium]|nr:imidazoleglycerol-phosphate dehydratase HisB [Clostridiales bacterium]
MRTAQYKRTTKETDISAALCLDGGEVKIDTGIPFFDHMLTAFAVHGGFGLVIDCKGDLQVDCHHTVEDTGIVIGKMFEKALGDKCKIARFGSFFAPMDETLAFAAVDISGRPYLHFEAVFPQERVGALDTCLVEEFFRAFASNSGTTVHIRVPYGTNSHHIAEAIFKAFAHSMKAATVEITDGIMSTKGKL